MTVRPTRRLAVTLGLLILSSALAIRPVFGDCRCRHPRDHDSTRAGANLFVVQIEQHPYRELTGRVEISDQPLEDVLVEVFDQPDYLLKNSSQAPPNQKRLAACVTATDGKFCFRGLLPGKYELRASLNSGVNITHVYVAVDKKTGSRDSLHVGMSLGI